MEICDLVNEAPDSNGKEAVCTLRRKLSGRSTAADKYKALVVTETCVKNCGEPFHRQVADREFVDVLVRTVGASSGLVREKVLELLQTWSDSFKDAPELQSIHTAYDELVGRGVEFPARNLDAMAPIHTPDATVEQPPRAAIPASEPLRMQAQQTDEELARELVHERRSST